MLRRGVVLLVAAVLAGAICQESALAHAELHVSDPLAGSTLGDTPTTVRLVFSERPEASLSDIRVLDTGGVAHQIGSPQTVADDPLALSVQVEPLERGVYTVSLRVVSAVDGHATTGAYAFGVGVPPTEADVAAASATDAVASPLEMLGRWILLLGLVVLLGAATASVARFGGPADVTLGAAGWLASVAGLILLAEAQRRSAAASLGDLWDTSIGRALGWRALALLAAGGALALANWSPLRIRRGAMLVAGLAALAAMGVHVSAGHAAAGDSTRVSIAFQWAHFAAVGFWIGGLAALLLGVRGGPSEAKAAAVRRFSTIAAAGLLVVVVTGVVRAVEQLGSWGQLWSSGYGRAVAAKSVLLIAIAAFGALNRWGSVPGAASSLGPLRRTSRGELAFAAAALAVAAVLGTLSPPAAGLPPLGITVSGADFATTVRVDLELASVQPGPNRFVVQAVDYDSDESIRAERVSLRFRPLDDPGVPPTTLVLRHAADGSYVGSGPNLAFDGRWGVTVEIERESGAVQVPLELETHGPPQVVSIERIPGEPPSYTVSVEGLGFIRVSPDPERVGPSTVEVTCFSVVADEAPIEQLVLTASAGDGAAGQRPVRRVSKGRFVAGVELEEGRNTIAVVARTEDGTRMRASFDLDVPGR